MILPELAGQATELAGELRQWKLEQAVALVPVHGDFYDKQVLVNAKGLALIDSDNAHLGDPPGRHCMLHRTPGAQRGEPDHERR